MGNQSVPVTEAIALLDESANRKVTDEDLRRASSLLVDQLRQQVKRGAERAAIAQAARVSASVSRMVDSSGAPIETDPLYARFDVEREETYVILEIARQLRTRIDMQQQGRADDRQCRNERTTRLVAIAGVLIALFVGIGQIVADISAK